MIIFKGKQYKVVRTKDITLDDIRAVFFPKNFYEKYKYLGSVPWREEGSLFLAIKPLVIYMDNKAKPWWCPRWFLRFLHLFGSDNSIVRVRNRHLHNLEKKITKGFLIWDYKTKWIDYDLRISISADAEGQKLASDIEGTYYRIGRRKELIEHIKTLDPNTKCDEHYTTRQLQEEIEKLEGNDN